LGGHDLTDLSADLLALTVPDPKGSASKIRHLLFSLIPPGQPNPTAVIAWSIWRRRHQQRARRCHWKRRTQADKSRL
jgi:hypothetical protein